MIHTASQIVDLKVLWRNVCARRGTAAPEGRGLEPLLSQLDDAQWRVLEATLQRCIRASETGQDMEVLSWGAACTRASSAARLEAVGLAWRPATLFAAGRMLMTQGWNMTARLVHLESSPADVAQLAKVMEDVEGRAIAPCLLYTSDAADE